VKVIVAGGDGFIGWPLAIALAQAGFHVLILDNFTRRTLVREVGSDSLVPILTLHERLQFWGAVSGKTDAITFEQIDVADDAEGLHGIVLKFQPDIVVHLATMPSAPYSMKNCRK